ncbi:coiled-coil domain-containing protein 191 isoform X2 [Carcharodon carcharias]|uniref:coiled-coil domain-containing protein 191 isoform X2 n=1 Tax=Carcharodon carcharias TaxID=13397 RepID=UPI001B7E172F|nr:coiled-coil domain-containing protein 191 isoform X2 [Carcharodon carcharias]
MNSTAWKAQPNMDPHDIQNWIKRVERASECAVAEVFPSKKSKINPKTNGYVIAMETIDQLHDHDDAYTEAQELLHEWMNSKIRPELEYEETEELESYINNSEERTYSPEVTSRMPAYEKFDELYSYLEQEKESAAAQTFLQQLLETKVVESGILEDLGVEEERQQKKYKDPRLSMEARHQQVRENRLKRQSKLEQQKQEKAMKKFAHVKAQRLLREEDRRKALQAKKEEELIKKEMVQLRKEMMERRCIMEETKRLEREHLDKEKKQKLMIHKKVKQALMELQEQQDQERCKIEHLRIMQQVKARIKAYQLQCLQKHFSIWYKLVLERRIKMGKARALFDWKSQLRAFQAWRTYTWGRKLEQEVQRTEMELREEKRKNQLATECNRKHRLSYCFTNWQLWCKAEKEKRELEASKEETKQKMAALLDSACSGKLSADSSRVSKCISETQQVDPAQEVEEENKQDPSPINSRVKESSKTQQIRVASPKYAWQVTHKHAALNSEERAHIQDASKISNWYQGSQTPNSPTAGRMIQHCQGIFEHRHRFQQQLIEKQKKQLQEQQKTIAELQDNQHLTILQEEAKLASALTVAIGNAVQMVQTQASPHGRKQSGNAQPKMKGTAVHISRLSGPSSAEESNCSRTSTNYSKTIHNLISPHPIVKAMEERAKQRLARRKKLEEIKRKKEQEKLAYLRAEEEERERQLQAEKQASLEKKIEERRLQRQREVEKQLRLEKEKEFQSAAEKHHQHFLLQKRGLEPWKKLVEISKQNMKLAEDYYTSLILHLCLRNWHQSVTESLAEKSFKAEKVYHGILLKRCFKNWLKCKDYCNIMEEKARQHYLTVLRRSTFIAWFGYVTEEKVASWEKERIGAEHNQRRIVKTAFKAWKSLPILIKEEIKKEERIKHLRKKVAEILPDFQT